MKNKPILKILITIMCSAILLAGCLGNLSDSTGIKQSVERIYSNQQILPVAEIFFAVTIPEPIPNGETLNLSIVDEVTGIPYNTKDYMMEKGDDLHYYVAIPFPVGSIVKYRFFRQGSAITLEDDFRDQLIRYRMYYVGGPGEVMDSVSGWSDKKNGNSYGRITGRIFDGGNNVGIPDLLVTAAGRQTLTDSNGSFVLEGMPEGNQNVVVYSVDGNYQPFQQGALIKADKRTPVSISLTPASFINMVFMVEIPDNTVPGVPIKFAGNLLRLGNSFSDLHGGLSNNSRSLSELSPLPDGRYMLSVVLPVGADIRYKYTLGDGLWNAESDGKDGFQLRQIIVPSMEKVVEDKIEAWHSDSFAPIIFDVTVPDDTPVTDDISIQFSTFDWTEPIQMWSLGNNRWVYQLFSPFHILDSIEYRYCRNDLCDLALDLDGNTSSWKRIAFPKNEPQNIQDQILAWKWTNNYVYHENLASNIHIRNNEFWTGLEILPNGNLSWNDFFPIAIQTAQDIGSNTIVLKPTWTITGNNPFEFDLKPGNDPFGSKLSETIEFVQSAEMKVVLFPGVNHQDNILDWWVGSNLDISWWDNWFARYKAFILYYSDLADLNNIQTLILGGDWLLPALPGGTLPDGSNSNIPMDTDARWGSLISDIRQHFEGQVYWAINYSEGLTGAPAFINDLDGIYLLWNKPLSVFSNPVLADMQEEAGRLLDYEVAPFKATFQKPLILAMAYPSISGSSMGCSYENREICENWSQFDQPNPEIRNNEINIQTQHDIYLAMLMAINERSWIDGVISRGFYVPLALQDGSASVYGKPTSKLLELWFHSFSGK